MEIEKIYPSSPADWRQWLEENHNSKQSVWLVFYTKKSSKDSISWSDAVDVALCFGWIDSKKQAIDEFSYCQFYSKRKAYSTWSKINKDKVKQLIETDLMTEAGYESIQIAKENGSWALLDDVEKLIIPEDLEDAFKRYKGSKEYFVSLSKSKRKVLLQWLVLAKQPKTRQKRIDEIAILASQQQIPKQF